MVSRAELQNDAEETQRLILDGRQVGIWTALPGIVQKVNFTAMTCEVQPAIKATIVNDDGSQQLVSLPLLVDVPIVFPSAGGFTMTFPMAAGDEVLVVMASRCIDAWWQQGGVQPPMEARMHDLSDGFAIPGPRSQPRVIGAINSSKLQIRNDAGTVYLSVGTKFSMTNASTDLKTVLTDLESLLNTFMGTLAAFGGGGAPVTQAMLQAPAITAVTQLAAVLVKIGALLE